MELVIAQQDAVLRIMELIEQAKGFLKKQGIDQWQDGYPDQSCIEDDIHNMKGYLCVEQNQIVGYVCIDFNGEPAYNNIDGKWLSQQAYVVVHRLTFDAQTRGKGLASQVFQQVEKMSKERNIHSFKIDTDENNHIMKHLLEKNGFQYCGIVNFQNSYKIAFEKII